MEKNLKQQTYEWAQALEPIRPGEGFFVETRDYFQARLDRMSRDLLQKGWIDEEHAYMISALIGEVGNNSFDHNVGSWPDIMGIFFGYDITEDKVEIVLADRGQGLLKTLSTVKPSLTNDSEALQTAFTEKISGRAPEARGNGLKFVKEGIRTQKMHLIFQSGNAQAQLNDHMDISLADTTVRGCFAYFTFEKTYEN